MTRVKMRKVFAGVVILLFAQASGSCPKRCRCPPPPEAPTTCAAGNSVIVDSCGCCNVCAQQLFEDCSKTQPCDHTKGLECNFGGGFAAKGICRAKSDGRTCEYGNKIYQNGELFHPTCEHRCACTDGRVACVPLCPRELSLPDVNCAKPERVTKKARGRGQCCEEQLICPEDGEADRVLAKGPRKHRASTGNLSKKNHLVLAWREKAHFLPAFRRRSVGVKCVSQATAWSACSKSCGTGMSVRMSNNNRKCKLVRETRICEVRPCGQREGHSKPPTVHPHN